MKELLTLLLVGKIIIVGAAGTAKRHMIVPKSSMQCYPKSVLLMQRTNKMVPAYTIPKGNVFCIMEDKLTRATGLWIKVGVQ